MSPPPPNYSNWPSIFWRPLLVVTLLNNHRKNDRLLVVTVHENGPALSSLTLPLCQPTYRGIRPFAINKALSGPIYTVKGHFYPRGAPVRCSGVIAPALTCSFLARFVSENFRILEKFELGAMSHSHPLRKISSRNLSSCS